MPTPTTTHGTDDGEQRTPAKKNGARTEKGRWKRAAKACGAAVAVIAVVAAAWLCVRPSPYFGDEGYHHNQIRMFLEGQLAMDPSITMLPGYHAVLAGMAYVTGYGYDDLNALRIYSACFSVLSVLFFFLVAKALGTRWTAAKVTQYLFIPILFPYMVLLYTDLMSVCFVLLGLYATLRRRYVSGALCGALAILVRQNNIMWLGFFFVLVLCQEYGDVILRTLGRLLKNLPKPAMRRNRMRAGGAAFTALVFFVCFALFAVFVKVNGGIAVGVKEGHPFPSFHIGNVVFLLMLTSVLFLPLHLDNVPRIIRFVRKEWSWLIPWGALAFIGYMYFYVNDSGYNQDIHSVFFRNRILVFSTLTVLNKALFFIPVAVSLLSLAVTRLRRASFYWLYPFTIAFLVPSWLIEQRYYFIPIALFLLFREDRSRRVEWTSAAYGIACTVLLFIPVALRWFFL